MIGTTTTILLGLHLMFTIASYSVDCFVTRHQIPLKSSFSSSFANEHATSSSSSCRFSSVTSSTAKSSSVDFTIAPSSEDDQSISQAAKFMIESFWLPQVSADDQIISAHKESYSGFTWAVTHDLTQRYGQILGKRAFNSGLLVATANATPDGSNSAIVGLVAVDVALIDTENNKLHNRETSENMLKDAMSSLGPKQRWQYKNSSVQEIVSDLLPSHTSVGVVLSNLAVNPSFRRNGVALDLCKEVERIAKEEWGFDKLCLRVESSNAAARALYEKKLKYHLIWTEKDAIALRADLQSGNFVECASDTLTLVKAL